MLKCFWVGSTHIISLMLLPACVFAVKIILAFWNYMNSSKRGSAYGFCLQSLDLVRKTNQPTNQPNKKSVFAHFADSIFILINVQLLDTKSTDWKEMLMHFIVRIIREKYPEVQNFYSELHFLDKAALSKYGRIRGFWIRKWFFLLFFKFFFVGSFVNTDWRSWFSCLQCLWRSSFKTCRHWNEAWS